ncbi:hypothetical protein [Hymenobacter terrenus]|uniref:hypothetical protein n=1 Tax=Hymenobacter terrenus TaxID=1629124 RepID=UPI0012DFF008|nr:hypothetical protein [Hymenobacter terrenus]
MGLDANQLWYGEPDGGGYAVLVTADDFNGDGNLTHVYLNDTTPARPTQLSPVEPEMGAHGQEQISGGTEMGADQCKKGGENQEK